MLLIEIKTRELEPFRTLKNNFFTETDIGCDSQKKSAYERRMEIYFFMVRETVLDQTYLCFLLRM